MPVKNRKRIIVAAASSAIAEHCLRLWAEMWDLDVVLIGRTLDKINKIALDLKVRSPNILIETAVLDFFDPKQVSQAIARFTQQKPLDMALIAQGWLPNQQRCQTDLQVCKDALLINAISPVLFAEAFVSAMEKNGAGTLAILGSVAGDRGRKSNYIYGAAKGLLDRYVEGLWHRLAHSAIKVILIKPGPTETPMTASLALKPKQLAKVQDVAQCIVKGIAQGKKVIYAPWKWRFIMLIVKWIPHFIFRRLNI